MRDGGRQRQRASVQTGPAHLSPDPISITAAGNRRRAGSSFSFRPASSNDNLNGLPLSTLSLDRSLRDA